MAYVIQETEQPRKKLQIKRLKFNLPKGDFYSLLIILLIGLDALSLIFLKQLESGITGLLIAILVLKIIHSEEKTMQKPNSEVENKVGVVDLPQF